MEAVAKLKNYPTSPRKMRLLADLVRGMKVEKALAILEHNPKHPAVPLHKLIWSAVHNWKQNPKNEGGDESELVVKTIFVDGARTLKRMRPAPQGRGYRVRKRSNHVTVILDVKGAVAETEPEVVAEETTEATPAKKTAKKATAKKSAPKKAAKKAAKKSK